MDEKQFEKAFKEYFPLLSKVAFSLVKNEDAAKDIVQHVFFKLWDKRDKYKIEISLKAYLYKAVMNSSLNYLEKEKRITPLTPSLIKTQEQTIEPEYEQVELADQLKNAISELPAKCQAVFSLSRFEGMSNKEIAQHLDISVKGVEKHIGKALKTLKTRLSPFLEKISIIFILLGRVFLP
jgi:RNA polymerase sigma-70 factor (ECF subfamily)